VTPRLRDRLSTVTESCVVLGREAARGQAGRAEMPCGNCQVRCRVVLYSVYCSCHLAVAAMLPHLPPRNSSRQLAVGVVARVRCTGSAIPTGARMPCSARAHCSGARRARSRGTAVLPAVSVTKLALALYLATSLTASRLLCQIRFGDGPDTCSVSRAFSCVVQLCGYFFAMFLC